MNEVEKMLVPVVVPLVKQLWEKTLLPAIQAKEASVASPELKILSDAALAMVNQVVEAELASLLAKAQA